MSGVLSIRIGGDNPNHHLWNNNGVWFVHYTVHPDALTKQRIRRSLQTKSLHVARRKRNQILAEVVRAETAFVEKPPDRKREEEQLNEQQPQQV